MTAIEKRVRMTDVSEQVVIEISAETKHLNGTTFGFEEKKQHQNKMKKRDRQSKKYSNSFLLSVAGTL